MDPETKANLIKTLQELRIILLPTHVHSFELKRLSNQLMEDVALFHHRETISVSVLVYSLYKIFQKNPTIGTSLLIPLIDKAIAAENVTLFRTSIKNLFDAVKKYDKDIDVNVKQLIKHAEVKRGMKAYAHGLSIGHAADIIGVSKWEIMEYLGTSNYEDDVHFRIDARSRLEFVRSLFS